MKKKTMVLSFISLVLILSIGMQALAASQLEDIRAYLNKGIQLVVNGSPWQAKSGEKIYYPITYEGSTYLPVRAVAEALNVPIQYDASTGTIYIGGTADNVPVLSEDYTLFSATITEDENDRKIHGVDYGKVIWFSKIVHSTSRFQLEPNGQYATLVVNVGIEGDDTRLKFVNANEQTEMKSVLLTEEDGIVEIELDITGVQKVMFEVMAEEPNTSSTVKIIANETYYK